MLASAALGAEAASEQSPVFLDIAGRRVGLDPADAARLRDAAAARAGTSSIARDLSILLGHALEQPHVIALRRSEAQTLLRVAAEIGFLALARAIEADPA